MPSSPRSTIQIVHRSLLAALGPPVFYIGRYHQHVIGRNRIHRRRLQTPVLPHKVHIDVSDYGRALPYQGDTSNPLILVRSEDMSDCNDYGNGGAAVVTLPGPGYVLREDGSLWNAAVIVHGISTAPATTSSAPTTGHSQHILTEPHTDHINDADLQPRRTTTPTSSTSMSPSSTTPSRGTSTGVLGKLRASCNG